MANKYTKKISPKKTELEHLYFTEYKTQLEIGLIYGTTQKVVFRWFRELGIKSRIAFKRFQTGELNPSWKGDNATYTSFHERVYSKFGKANMCTACGRSDSGISYDWANQTGKYSDPDDYKMMCRSCHFKKDGHMNNLPNRISEKLTNKKQIINGH